MTTYKAQIFTHKDHIKDDGKTNIKIRIFHNKHNSYLSTENYITPTLFNNKSGLVKPQHPNAKLLNEKLRGIIDHYEAIELKLGDRANAMDGASFSKYIKDAAENGDNFLKFGRDFVQELRDKEKLKTARVYEGTLNAIEKFKFGRDIVKEKHDTLKGICEYKWNVPSSLDFCMVNYQFLLEFEAWLRKQSDDKYSLKTNSISVHMRNIRALFNRAIDLDKVELNAYPFRKYKITQEETEKRNIKLEEIAKIRDADLKNELDIIARDIFMLIFYMIGINMKDLLFLKHEDIRNGRVKFTRFKTGKKYSIKLEPEMEAIFNRYKGSKYLLRFNEKYAEYNNFMKRVNFHLQGVAKGLEINEELTTYYARHSWATIGHKLRISKEDIRLSLGHGKKTTTDIYIEVDLGIIDKTNRQILDALKAI